MCGNIPCVDYLGRPAGAEEVVGQGLTLGSTVPEATLAGWLGLEQALASHWSENALVGGWSWNRCKLGGVMVGTQTMVLSSTLEPGEGSNSSLHIWWKL